jgi:uracil-DNA glycosylase
MQSGVVGDFAAWRTVARERLAALMPPDAVAWSDRREPSLFGGGAGCGVGALDAAGGGLDAASGAVGARGYECGGPNGAVGARGAECAAPSGKVGAPVGAARPGGACTDPSAVARGHEAVDSSDGRVPSISRELLALLELLACYRDPGRWDLMYRLTWRAVHENRALLQNDADSDVRRARLWSKAVSQDVHKMHAFVRFHETPGDDDSPCYVAWFEPSHEILRYAVPFFEKRFGNMRWMIATPHGAAVWNGSVTEYVESPGRSAVPRDDSTHELWRAYYRNICNIARVNPRMMQREMPQRYWRHLPEATEIHTILQDNPRVLHQTLSAEASAAAENLRTPRAVARALDEIVAATDSPQTCQRCTLWQRATQAVLGEGPKDARVMLIGEQPGDEEDLRGRAFVGPAGRVLDDALRQAGVARGSLYVTNSVKHFKWEPRGKRRLHAKPNQQEIHACNSWLQREISEVAPRVIVAMGATALRAVTGLTLTIEAARHSDLRAANGALVIATYHPSAILRAPDERKEHLMSSLVEDLTRAGRLSGPLSESLPERGGQH